MGAPLQPNDTLPFSPLGAIVSLYSADCPAVMVAVEEEPEEGAIEKSVPFPERVTVWGLPPALSVTVRMPELLPAAVGLKVTLMAQ
jgi:hypothetical protein